MHTVKSLLLLGLAAVGAAQSASSRRGSGLSRLPPSVASLPIVTLMGPVAVPTGLGTTPKSISAVPPSSGPRRPTPGVPTSRSAVLQQIVTVVSSFVTICATPTTVTINGVRYSPTTSYQPITVTNCPCTIVPAIVTPVPNGGPAPSIVTGRLASTATSLVPGATKSGAAAVPQMPAGSQQPGVATSGAAAVSGKPVQGTTTPASPYVLGSGNTNVPQLLSAFFALIFLAAVLAL